MRILEVTSAMFPSGKTLRISYREKCDHPQDMYLWWDDSYWLWERDHDEWPRARPVSKELLEERAPVCVIVTMRPGV